MRAPTCIRGGEADGSRGIRPPRVLVPVNQTLAASGQAAGLFPLPLVQPHRRRPTPHEPEGRAVDPVSFWGQVRDCPRKAKGSQHGDRALRSHFVSF